jgi:protein phosphatase
MATTVTALLLAGERLALVHVGDSRAYRLRDGELTQLSTDHTYVQMLVDRGAITADEAWHHPQRSMVTRVIPSDPLRPQAEQLDPQPGDRYLLCSDGLSDVVPDAVIAEALTSHDDRQAAAHQLVELALDAGGPDNITVIVADVDA